ncbi:MAG: hypothetical protein WAS56_07125 [Saprospiraceae bacterium]
MKNIFSLLFLTAYLFSATHLMELLKLPMLVRHYQEHKTENANLSLLEFLDMHYANGNPIDEDYDKDMQLPFKSITLSSISFVTICANFTDFVQKEKIIIKEGKQKFFDHSFDYSTSYLVAIWQPPKSI